VVKCDEPHIFRSKAPGPVLTWRVWTDGWLVRGKSADRPAQQEVGTDGKHLRNYNGPSPMTTTMSPRTSHLEFFLLPDPHETHGAIPRLFVWLIRGAGRDNPGSIPTNRVHAAEAQTCANRKLTLQSPGSTRWRAFWASIKRWPDANQGNDRLLNAILHYEPTPASRSVSQRAGFHPGPRNARMSPNRSPARCMCFGTPGGILFRWSNVTLEMVRHVFNERVPLHSGDGGGVAPRA